MSTPTDPITVPVPMPTGNALPPFLVKTYDIVDDPSFDNTQQSHPPHPQTSSVGACIEVKKFGLEEEVERLKRDRNILMKELVRLMKQQQTTDNQMQSMVERLQGMEQRQQKMMSFFAKGVNSPGFLSYFVQHQNETTKLITKGSKKRRLKQDGVVSTGHNELPDSQSIKYQPIITLEVMQDQSVPLEANSDVVATSPLAVGQESPFIPYDLDMVSNVGFIGPNMVLLDIEVVATSPLAVRQELPYKPDDLHMVSNDAFIDNLDMVPNDAFIGLDMVPSDIENFLLNSDDEEWNNNLLVEIDNEDLAFHYMIGFRMFTAYLDPFLPMNIITSKAYNTIMVEGLEGTGKNLVAIIKDIYMFVESFTYITDFVVLDDIGEFILSNMAEVLMGKPFRKITKLEYNFAKGLVSYTKIFDTYIFKMPRTIPRLRNFNWSKIPPLLELSQRDLMSRFRHPYEKNKLMYNNSLNLGPECQVNESMKEWLIRGHVSIHETT
nr:heat shock factor protein HSF8-like [Tanacetum cinerariifolium]